MRLIPIGIIIVVLFLAMTAVMYFVAGQIKPMEAELTETKRVLSSHIEDFRDTEDQLSESLEINMKLRNELDAADAKITEMETQLKRLQNTQ